MNHEELLAKINDVGHSVEYGHGIDTSRIVKQLSALQAVVELHKPDSNGDCLGCDNRCGCYEGDILDYNIWETCPTIQVIEKELQ